MRYLSIGIMFFCAILMLSAGLNAQEAEAQTGPDWLKNVDPNDYLLLASDLNEPYFLDPSCATIPGCIYSDIRDQETAIGSRISKDNISILFCQEAIVRRPPGDKERSEFDINVYVFETPGLAESYRKELSKHGLYVSLPDNKSIKENVTPTYNGLNDPRLEGVGYSSSLGNWIRYKNIVAEISGVNDLEANYLYVPILSRLWLDKVTKIKPAYAQCQLEVELDTEETNESSIVQISVINEITEMPVQGADLKIVVTDQKSGISNTSQAKTDLNGQYMLNFSWQPADFGKTFLVEVDATLEECSDYSSLYIIAPPITGIIGDVLEAGLLTPPVTNGYVWISPPQIDDVSKLSPNTTPPIIKSFKLGRKRQIQYFKSSIHIP